MTLSPDLLLLARYIAGEFDNQPQAAAEPVWYVHLRLWQRPVALFTDDSVTLFAEQANALILDQPYRQRLLRLQQSTADDRALQVQYYGFKNPVAFKGAGRNPELLKQLTIDQVEQLPGCVLHVTQPQPAKFAAFPPPDACCYFEYQGEQRQVSLGFEAGPDEFKSYDKGVEPGTDRALWGAIMGPYQFSKQQSYALVDE